MPGALALAHKSNKRRTLSPKCQFTASSQLAPTHFLHKWHTSKRCPALGRRPTENVFRQGFFVSLRLGSTFALVPPLGSSGHCLERSSVQMMLDGPQGGGGVVWWAERPVEENEAPLFSHFGITNQVCLGAENRAVDHRTPPAAKKPTATPRTPRRR